MRAQRAPQAAGVDVEDLADALKREQIVGILGEDPRAHVVKGAWRGACGAPAEDEPQRIIEDGTDELQLR